MENNKIIIDVKSYNIHPIYTLYAGSEDGYVIHVVKRNPTKGILTHNGYLQVVVRKHGESKWKGYQTHRFIWECYNGIIDDGKVIDHINDIKVDNRLCNLQIMTQQVNCKKSAKNRDYSFVGNNHRNRRLIKAVNLESDEETYYHSMYACCKHIGVNCGIIKMCAEGKNRVKSGKSKKDGQKYRFEYVEDPPEGVKVLKSTDVKD